MLVGHDLFDLQRARLADRVRPMTRLLRRRRAETGSSGRGGHTSCSATPRAKAFGEEEQAMIMQVAIRKQALRVQYIIAC